MTPGALARWTLLHVTTGILAIASALGCRATPPKPPQARRVEVELAKPAPAAAPTTAPPTDGLELCAVAAAPTVELFPIQNAAFVLVGPDFQTAFEMDDRCPNDVLELRGDELVQSPWTLGLPCAQRPFFLWSMGGSVPEHACATFIGERGERTTFVRKSAKWIQEGAFDGGCEHLQSWVGDRQIALVAAFVSGEERKGQKVGDWTYALAATPHGKVGLPRLAFDRVGGRRGDADAFAFGAAPDGTVVVGWSTADKGELVMEHWAPGKATTTLLPLGIHARGWLGSTMRVHSRDDVDLVASVRRVGADEAPLLLHFDGARWTRLDAPSATTATLTSAGDLVAFGDEGLTARRRDGTVIRRRVGRVLLDGEPITLLLHALSDASFAPVVWATRSDDPWIVSDFVRPSQASAEHRRALLHVCPSGRAPRKAVRARQQEQDP